MTKTMSKVSLGMGQWNIEYASSLEAGGFTSETVEIGCCGNWVHTDSCGSRYVPIIDEGDSDTRGYESFKPKKYLRISSWGDVSYLLSAEKV